MIEIQRMTTETEPIFLNADERRLDSEEVAVRVGKGGFTLEYRPKPNALWHMVTRGEAEQTALGAGEKYVALLDGAPAGRMALRIGEHRLALVEGLCVPLAVRRRGAGRAMLAFAGDWARERGLCGLCVETQDTNAGACQFLTRCGFALGGIDTLRYVCASPEMRKAPAMRETALYFYRMI